MIPALDIVALRYLAGEALRLAGRRSSKGGDDIRCRVSDASVVDGNEGIEQRMQWSVLMGGYALSGKRFDEGLWCWIENIKRD